MLVSTMAAHSRENGSSNLFILFALVSQRFNFFGIHLHQLLKAFLIPGEENKKPQDENQHRGNHGDIQVIFGVREKRPQQAVRVARIQQRIHGKQPDDDHQNVNDVNQRFRQQSFILGK